MHVGRFFHSHLLTAIVAEFFYLFITGSGRALGLEILGDPPLIL